MSTNHSDRDERLAVLVQLEDWLELPMRALGFIWLGLLVLELTRGLSPFLATLTTAIWVVFILDFVLRMALAPDKSEYLKRNWFGALSLALPALRIFRAARAVRVLRASRTIRGIRLVKVVGSVNRSMRVLGRSMGRRGLGYVLLLTFLVTIAGAAGMYALENDLPNGRGFDDYLTALWWTAMMMTTMGSEYWPRTGEGRLLCLLLAIYAFTVFGYVTASLASFFVGRDAENSDAEIAGQAALDALRVDIDGLRGEIRALRQEREA